MTREYDIDSIRTGYSQYDISNSYSKVYMTDEIAKSINLSIIDTEHRNNWYYKDGKYYYFKKSKGVYSVINELLGEDFSRYMGLPTVSYELIDNSEKETIGLISENVRKTGVIYCPCRFLSKSELDYIKHVFFDADFECDKKFKRDLTYYIVGNYFSTLRDRYINSEIIVREDGFEIPPILDYESSFFEHLMDVYSDPMLSVTFDSETILMLRENNEYFDEALNRVMSYSMLDALNRIEKKHTFGIPMEIKTYYMNYAEYRKCFIEDMGLINKANKKTTR